MLHSLMDVVGGRYAVMTSSGSRYVLDLDRCRLARVPVEDPIIDRTLRQDAAEIELVQIVECTVGRPLVMLIDLKVPGVVVTQRRSTPVLLIERLPPMVQESL